MLLKQLFFKKGTTRAEYERALPDLIHYYMFLHDVSTTPFDVNRAANLELEWWIVHRQRTQHQPGDLDSAVAESAAEFYRVPTEKLLDYGHDRSEAMTIRDSTAEQGGVTEENWKSIESLLRRAYRSLWETLHN